MNNKTTVVLTFRVRNNEQLCAVLKKLQKVSHGKPKLKPHPDDDGYTCYIKLYGLTCGEE